MYRIFIVEDDAAIAQAVCEQAGSWALEARCVTDFRRVAEEAAAYDPHLILLDISLPFFDGYHWCRQIRKSSRVPIIFLSSAADNMNIVMAMNMGADDFIAKPFDRNVLMAKVQALLRRAYDFTVQPPVAAARAGIVPRRRSGAYQQAQRRRIGHRRQRQPVQCKAARQQRAAQQKDNHRQPVLAEITPKKFHIAPYSTR